MIEFDGQARQVDAAAIRHEVKGRWLLRHIVIKTPSGTYKLYGLGAALLDLLNRSLSDWRDIARNAYADELARHVVTLMSAWDRLHHSLTKNCYLAAHERAQLIEDLSPQRTVVESGQALLKRPYAKAFSSAPALQETLGKLQPYLDKPEAALSRRNRQYVLHELAHWRPLFDHCEERPLTDEQAIAAITLEENTLLVAAAGSGKTSTIVGKVIYLIAKGIARPDEILCLTFNRNAAAELRTRIRQRLTLLSAPESPLPTNFRNLLVRQLAGASDVTAKTFHALGVWLVQSREGSKHPNISTDAESSERLQRAIRNCLKNPDFSARWWLFQSVYRTPDPEPSRFASQEDYDAYLQKILRQKSQAEGVITLADIAPVKSLEELRIANWLYVMGVDFEYETPFEEGRKRLTNAARWLVDFSYRLRGPHAIERVVHEHFALDADGKAPTFFKDPKGYAASAKQKAVALRALDSRHFWTTSAQFRRGTLFDHLTAHLAQAGIPLRPRSADQIEARLTEIGQHADDEVIVKAVSNVRANGLKSTDLSKRCKSQPDPARAQLFLSLVLPIAEEMNRLISEEGRMDYDEMIRRGNEYLEQDPSLSPFRILLVDEFQDTAPGRGRMLRNLVAGKEAARIFGVGDDWQAINRFAGADLELFLQFGPSFNRRPGADARCDLSQTFRTNQGIADISSRFVLKNKEQLSKRVEAADKTNLRVIDVRTYYKASDVMELITSTLETWLTVFPTNAKPTVMILGRYSADLISGISKAQIDALWNDYQSRISVVNNSLYTTMHRSKGLQADHVLILGMYNVYHDFFCFPSEIEEDPLNDLTRPQSRDFRDAEERRLFYVAMTRAKSSVTLLSHEGHMSRYVQELIRENREGSVIYNGSPDLPPCCPSCTIGVVLKRFNAQKKKTFYACSNRHGCGRMWAQISQTRH
ncbi:UvrD-helicase domain-containing protein [Lysobacter sp. Root604]|uniref:UvrD-helicase domain-containing protein n=1 Tax=Lysobacter sp. Root604 TaxID=1736568 RepID=UPI00138F6D4A|nr:UvrD-helicase domain-containing protein [Lysobacter sp. Root604]